MFEQINKKVEHSEWNKIKLPTVIVGHFSSKASTKKTFISFLNELQLHSLLRWFFGPISKKN